jgi:fructose-1,6-bisphosphatase/sedoheptulose 1,7-bisphosphatase-like protein
MGVGGWEEGVIAAAAARVLGGEAIGQRSTRDGASFGEILSLDQLVPGSEESTFVAFTPITHEQYFDIRGVEIIGRHIGAYPTIIDRKGLRTSLDIRHLSIFKTPPQDS